MTSPIGMLGGKRDARPWARQPAVTTACPLCTCLVESMKSRMRSPGSPTFGPDHALHARSGTTLAETALEWSAISVTCAEPPVTAETVPTSPSPLTTGSSTRDAVVAADVDRDVGEPDGRASGRSPFP